MLSTGYITTKKGPLYTVWLAANWEKKLTKASISDLNIQSTITTIISPNMQIALRTSAHLLLGVVRIYSRKAKYLLVDCSEAYVRIKSAFRPGIIDLPKEGKMLGSNDQILLPQTFGDFDIPLSNIRSFRSGLEFVENESHLTNLDKITIKSSSTLNIPKTRHQNGLLGMQAIDEFGPNENLLDDSDTFRGHSVNSTTTAMDTLLSGITDTHMLDGPTDPSNTIVMDTPLNDEFGGGAGLLTDLPNLDLPFHEMASTLPPMIDPELMDISENNPQQEQQERNAAMPEAVIDTPMWDPTPLPEVSVQDNAQNGETILENGHSNDVVMMPKSPTDTFRLDGVDHTFMPDGEVRGTYTLEVAQQIGSKDRMKRKRKLLVDSCKVLTNKMIRTQLCDCTDTTYPSRTFPPLSRKAIQCRATCADEQLLLIPAMAVNIEFFPQDMLDIYSKNFAIDAYKYVDYNIEDPFLPPNSPQPEKLRSGLTLNSSSNTVHLPESSFKTAPPTENSLLNQPEPPVPQFDDTDLTIQSPTIHHSLTIPEPPPIDEPLLDQLDIPTDSSIQEPSAPENELTNNTANIDDVIPLATAVESELAKQLAEQLEEKRWNQRTKVVLKSFKQKFRQTSEISLFEDVIPYESTSKKQAASIFYSCLLLTKESAICVSQPEAFGDITIKKGNRFSQV